MTLSHELQMMIHRCVYHEKKNDDDWHQVGQTITGDDGWCYDVSLDGDGTTLVGSAPSTDSTGDMSAPEEMTDIEPF